MNNITQIETLTDLSLKKINAFCIYCQQKRRLINTISSLECNICNIEYIYKLIKNKEGYVFNLSGYKFFVELLGNDNIYIYYIPKTGSIIFGNPNCLSNNQQFYDFKEKENVYFKDFIKEYKKLKKIKKLNLFL